MSELIYIDGFSGGIDSQAAARLMLNLARGSSCPVLWAFMEQERLKRLADRSRQFGIEGHLDTALNAGERMRGIRIRQMDYVFRKLIALNELHPCSLSLRRGA